MNQNQHSLAYVKAMHLLRLQSTQKGKRRGSERLKGRTVKKAEAA